MSFEFSQKKYEQIISQTTGKTIEIYRSDILNLIETWDKIPVKRNFLCENTNTDFLITSENGERFTIRDFVRQEYNIAPYFKDGEEFGYVKNAGLGGKQIYCPKKYKESIGFWLAIGHETAHAKNHQQETKIHKLFSRESAKIYNEKKARTDGYHIAKNLEKKYKINVIHEFKSLEDICRYANIHLLSYLHPDHVDQTKKILLEPKHFLI